ncbi:MAG TPA: tetratricopeptide repeat protein [Candidatus Baltobacteraceae bacterium]|jgi:tetratricopeptide (TPR) repeat protein|nr:tetratricopeptide repeat protein [Candidatus Baltobacteraceae bacterium]
MAEKTLNQIPRPLREQFEKGQSAFDRNNFDYAVAIFTGILAQEPAFYDCREALRAAQSKNKASGHTFFKKMLSGASSSPLLAKGQIELMKNPLDALKTAEQILTSDPNSAAGHKLLADAAMAADLPKTAVLSLKIVVKNSPKDEESQKNLARAFSASGQGEKAEMILSELMRQHPNDLRLVDELKDISARKTLAEGGYEALSGGTGSYRDILKNKDESVALEQEHRNVKTDDVTRRMITEHETRLAAEPNNFKILRSVAELYTQRKEFDRALEAYNRIVAQEGATDPSLLKAISETTMKKYEASLGALDQNAPDYAEKSAQIKLERDAFLLAETKQRADRYPNDLGIRFELGELYFKLGRINEAMPEFQKAQGNPHKRLQAMSYMGQCLARRGMNDMAAATLRAALKEKAGFDEEKKELIYALGSVLEKMGKAEEAMEQYKQIYQIDMGFKDVAAKIDAYYQGNSGQT